MVEEIWRPVKGYERYYEVSNLGRVRSLDRVTIVKATKNARPYFKYMAGKILNVRPKKGSGYYYVALFKNGRSRFKFVHVLVAESFIGPKTKEKPYVRHLNCVPTDNRLENLAYGNQYENMMDNFALDIGPNQKLLTKQVYEIRERTANGESLASLAREYGVSVSAIGAVKDRRTFAWLE